MPTTRSLTLALVLMLTPALAEAAPRANAPAASAPAKRPAQPPVPANSRPTPAAKPTKPVPEHRHAASPRRDATVKTAVDPGTHTPRTRTVDPGTRTPRPAKAIDTGIRTPRPTPGNAVDPGTRTPRTNPVDNGTRTSRSTAVDTGARTPRPTAGAAVDTGTRTPRAATPAQPREPASPRTNTDAAPAAHTPSNNETHPSRSGTSSAPSNDEARPARSDTDSAPSDDEAHPAPSDTAAHKPDSDAAPAPKSTKPRDPVAPTLDEPTAPSRAQDAAADAAAPRAASPRPTRDAAPVESNKPVPEDSPAPALANKRPPSASPETARTPRPATAVQAAPTKPRATKPAHLHPQREPLLARHPAASCSLDPLEAVGLRQHERTRDSLREFYWSDMARFFETTFDESEPTPRQADDPAFLPASDVIATLPSAARSGLQALASARTVDRLSGRNWTKINKLLAGLAPADVAALLRADSPTLRAHVWTWMATTKTGGCHLGHVDVDFLEAAVADRSVAVEHGDDLVYRSLGDYALEARARLATLDPARFDSFLTRLTAATEVDPLVRATAHGVLLRRARWDVLDTGLRDPSPSVRAATASAAIEMNQGKLEARLVEHAASDPIDLVTEQIVGGLLGVHDPHNHGRPQLRGLLATTKDERLTAAVARWRGRGDALAPLPVPAHPLKFSSAPVPKDTPSRPAPKDTPMTPRPYGASVSGHVPAEPSSQTPAPQPARIPTLQDSEDDDSVRMPPLRP